MVQIKKITAGSFLNFNFSISNAPTHKSFNDANFGAALLLFCTSSSFIRPFIVCCGYWEYIHTYLGTEGDKKCG